MCRYVAYAGTPLPARDLVFTGAHSLVTQSYAPRELLSGTVNADGYGVAWYDGATPSRIREARPIWHDADLEGVLTSVKSHCVVAVVRNATVGLPIDRAGLAPLMSDRWTFALNGYIEGFRSSAMRRLREPLSDELYARIEGTSDTETLFLLALAELGAGASLGGALVRVSERVLALAAEAAIDTQLNMVMADGVAIAATRTSSSEETNSLYMSEEGTGVPGGVVIASEPLDGEGKGWAPVPAHSLVEASRGEGPRVTPIR